MDALLRLTPVISRGGSSVIGGGLYRRFSKFETACIRRFTLEDEQERAKEKGDEISSAILCRHTCPDGTCFKKLDPTLQNLSSIRLQEIANEYHDKAKAIGKELSQEDKTKCEEALKKANSIMNSFNS